MINKSILSCLIVDDEQSSLPLMLEKFCPDVKLLGVAQNITEAKKLIAELQPNLVFLDVEMPGGNGFELLESLDSIKFSVVFTTAHASYAIKAIKYAAMDYLLKPIDVSDLKLALKKCHKKSFNLDLNEQIEVLKSNRSENQFNFNKIALPTADGLQFFLLDDIILCEADRSYCKFHLNDNRKIHISKPMSDYEDLLVQANFLKVHKSSIINLSHVVQYNKGASCNLEMSNGSKINVAIRRKDIVIKALKQI